MHFEHAHTMLSVFRSEQPKSESGLLVQRLTDTSHDQRRAGYWDATTPNETVAPIHDGLPVILPPSAWDAWLDTTNDDTKPSPNCWYQRLPRWARLKSGTLRRTQVIIDDLFRRDHPRRRNAIEHRDLFSIQRDSSAGTGRGPRAGWLIGPWV
jgi:hypothetical protein